MNLSDLYFLPKKWEGNGTLYKWLGVIWYKQFITWLGKKVGRDSKKQNNYFLWDKSEAGIRAFEAQTRSSELSIWQEFYYLFSAYSRINWIQLPK